MFLFLLIWPAVSLDNHLGPDTSFYECLEGVDELCTKHYEFPCSLLGWPYFIWIHIIILVQQFRPRHFVSVSVHKIKLKVIMSRSLLFQDKNNFKMAAYSGGSRISCRGDKIVSK